MAWVSVKEQGHLNTSENTAKERTATRVFVCVSDTPTTTVAAESAPGILISTTPPSHPDDIARKLKSITANAHPESGRKVFTVELHYSNVIDAADAQAADPLDRGLKINWDFDDRTEPYFVDRTPDTPKPVVNSAGEPFETLLERDAGSITAVVRKNIAANGYSPAIAVAYKNAVNTDAFTIDGVSIGVGECKMKSYTAGELQTENGVTYRVAQWLLQFRESWDDEVEDRGFNEAGTAGKLKEIIKGVPPVKVDRPWPLDGAGVAKANATDAPEPLTFKPYNGKPFAGFPFS